MSDSDFPSTPPYFQKRTTDTYLPLVLEGNDQQEKFWLVNRVTAWHENGVSHERHELMVCCRDCDFRYTSTPPAVSVKNLLHIGQEAVGHVKLCPFTVRTIPLPGGKRDV